MIGDGKSLKKILVNKIYFKIILVDVRKYLFKIQYLGIIFSKLGLEGNVLICKREVM